MRGVIATILILTGLGGGLWWALRKHDHNFDRQIFTIARQYDLPPGLVKAVVWQESRFRAGVRGNHEEIGLMQLQPTSAQEWADAGRNTDFHPDHLMNAETNLHAGCFYLSKLIRRYPKADNPWVYALADYNAGRGNVIRWLEGPAETNSTAFLKAITFPKTRKYVQSILERTPIYQAEFR